MTRKQLINITAGLIGNIVEHHDKALFALLAPFIGPLFFSSSDPITALINTYSIMFVGMFARPFGALIYGYIADRYGRKKALTWSIVGMSVATGAMGCLPLYAEVGLWAPALLALARILQNFFSAGETNGAAIFVLEHSLKKDKPFISSLVEASTMAGILLASIETVIFSYFDILTIHWRWLMWAGSAAGLIGLWLRRYCSETEAFQSMQEPLEPQSIRKFFSSLIQDARPIAAITLAAGFSCATYVIPLPLMTAFLTLTSPMTATQLTSFNTSLMVLDLALLPIFGYLCSKVSKEKAMLTAASITALTAIPLFQTLSGGALIAAIIVRATIVILGVSFAAPFRLWAKEQIPIERRCTGVNIGCSLAHILIEGPAAVVSLWLFKMTGWIASPGIYLACTALLAVFALTKLTVTRTEKACSLS